MSEVLAEAKQLLAASPEDFVAERNRLVRELRQAGRAEDARMLSELRKPTAVVLAVNRAARDRPQAARDAARAAEQLAKIQLSGDPDEYRKSRDELDRALALLAEVAVAHLSRGKPASEAMRRRVADLLRASAADSDARAALERGLLQEEGGAAGFSAFAGMTPSAGRRRSSPAAKTKEADRRAQARRERERRLEEELARAEESLEEAERALQAAGREREKAARAVASVAERLQRLKAS
jgi:predicted ribosome quality control (RQC) complex YloA/Tae2 family protein